MYSDNQLGIHDISAVKSVLKYRYETSKTGPNMIIFAVDVVVCDPLSV